jgi:hypothetical protein
MNKNKPAAEDVPRGMSDELVDGDTFDITDEPANGAASSLITLLLWIYYAAQILLFGAEFTQVYANTYGTHVEPQEHAVKIEKVEKVVTT